MNSFNSFCITLVVQALLMKNRFPKRPSNDVIILYFTDAFIFKCPETTKTADIYAQRLNKVIFSIGIDILYTNLFDFAAI